MDDVKDLMGVLVATEADDAWATVEGAAVSVTRYGDLVPLAIGRGK